MMERDGQVPEWSKGADLRSAVQRTRGFEPHLGQNIRRFSSMEEQPAIPLERCRFDSDNLCGRAGWSTYYVFPENRPHTAIKPTLNSRKGAASLVGWFFYLYRK